MKLKNMAGRLLLLIIIITGLITNAPGCIAGSGQHSPGVVQYTNLEMSPFKGPPTAPVVITLFSDFQ